MILVITTIIRNKQGRQEMVADHGVNLDTGKNLVLPPEHPSLLGAKYDPGMGEWVIADDPTEKPAEKMRVLSYS